ncbi:4-alpha-glucanotransferase [Desulfuromonas versatilis]|uniref:4-alpha-glucanotransferase n=1 Tax=Desulfuromonas versatilis TaxID=2802975 RepID=A0ABN6E1J5_9BACT|nr:4-alpha-glucanotransferase [Desulfuromonas versatilis]BCR06037.1 4-alpha-glucanotransferase [Desulfuromonas versatilis]
MKLKRSSGILLHPTSLPGPFGIGSLGIEAYRFIDLLSGAGQSVWQILPLGPTGYGDSPYSCFSAFAGNPLLICLERLVEEGELEAEDLAGVAMPEGECNFGFAHGFKGRLLHKAAQRFFREAGAERREAFDRFCCEQGYWVQDYALFQALRKHFEDAPWYRWPEPIRRREPEALRSWGEKLAEPIRCHQYAQFIFFEQWFALKAFANRRGVKILGDIPIFVALDSADVWANPTLFHLDETGQPTLVAGVPPDYFSATGQRWGNPLYRWEAMAAQDWSWWLARFRWNLAQADMVRVDHFRGFEACWAIPAAEQTAVRGSWMPAPGAELFTALAAALGDAPIVAEDLGVITPEVEALRERFALPGMKILQFAFGSGAGNPYLPHNLPRHCVVYTGTHDNNTTAGWWQGLSRAEREGVRGYLGSDCRDIAHELMRLAMASVADLCIFPLQDVLGLEEQARMNTPGKSRGNWGWRLLPGAFTGERQKGLRALAEVYGRWSSPHLSREQNHL